MYRIDASSSRVAVRTEATGLLARLAHDLEIAARKLEGTAEVDGERWSAELRFLVDGLRVVGVVRKGKVDESVLSTKDVGEIEDRIRELVFPRAEAVTVVAEGSSRSQGRATVTWRGGEQSLPVRLRLEQRSPALGKVSGSCQLSLSRLGVAEIKGPLGAFKVHDGVEIRFSIAVRSDEDHS